MHEVFIMPSRGVAIFIQPYECAYASAYAHICRCLVYMLNRHCSGICGGALFREERLTLAERGKMDVLKINDGARVNFVLLTLLLILVVVVVVYLTTNQRHIGYLSSGNGHLARRYSTP